MSNKKKKKRGKTKSVKEIAKELKENIEKIFGPDAKIQSNMDLLKCRFCLGEVVCTPEYNTPPLMHTWCEDCGEFTFYCQKCFLMTDDPNHKCHFQKKLF